MFLILCAFQTASGQKTTIQLLKATQATHISRKSELKKILNTKQIKIPQQKHKLFFLKKKTKLLKDKIKYQVAFRQKKKLPYAENTQNTFPPQELLGTTLKLDPLLH